MSKTPDITNRLAQSLRDARRSKGLSLDAVAKLSGVSRSMVSQIERGESSPTVATLWNLTQALQVDFAGLLDTTAAHPIDIIRAGDVPTIAGRGTGVRILILSAPETVGQHEIYDLRFDAGASLVSSPHRPGCREQLTVVDGALTVVSGQNTCVLAQGDTARYAADLPHTIAASDGQARGFLVVTNG